MNKLKDTEVTERGDILFFSDGDTMEITGCAGQRVNQLSSFGSEIFSHVERPDDGLRAQRNELLEISEKLLDALQNFDGYGNDWDHKDDAVVKEASALIAKVKGEK